MSTEGERLQGDRRNEDRPVKAVSSGEESGGRAMSGL